MRFCAWWKRALCHSFAAGDVIPHSGTAACPLPRVLGAVTQESIGFELTIFAPDAFKSPAILTDCRAFFSLLFTQNCRAGPWRQKALPPSLCERAGCSKVPPELFLPRATRFAGVVAKSGLFSAPFFPFAAGRGILAHGLHRAPGCGIPWGKGGMQHAYK